MPIVNKKMVSDEECILSLIEHKGDCIRDNIVSCKDHLGRNTCPLFFTTCRDALTNSEEENKKIIYHAAIKLALSMYIITEEEAFNHLL